MFYSHLLLLRILIPPEVDESYEESELGAGREDQQNPFCFPIHPVVLHLVEEQEDLSEVLKTSDQRIDEFKLQIPTLQITM